MKNSLRARRAAALCATLALAACEAFDYHPYCVDSGGKARVNAANAARIEEALAGRRAFRFAFVSDTQRWYDETADFVADVNRRADVDFVVHGGDFSDFGVNDEFLWQRGILDGLGVPYVSVIGNHDCIGTGEQSYGRFFGDTNYAFTAADVRFVLMNTNALEFDYSDPVPDIDFLRRQIEGFPDACARAIVVAHCKPFDEQFNNNMAEYYHAYVRRLPGVMFHLSGHTHKAGAYRLFEGEPYRDDFTYYTTTCVEDREYMVFDISEEGYSYEVVRF